VCSQNTGNAIHEKKEYDQVRSKSTEGSLGEKDKKKKKRKKIRKDYRKKTHTENNYTIWKCTR